MAIPTKYTRAREIEETRHEGRFSAPTLVTRVLQGARSLGFKYLSVNRRDRKAIILIANRTGAFVGGEEGEGAFYTSKARDTRNGIMTRKPSRVTRAPRSAYAL